MSACVFTWIAFNQLKVRRPQVDKEEAEGLRIERKRRSVEE